MTWEKFCEVFRVSFTKEIQLHQIKFMLYCDKFKITDVFSISPDYYETMCLEHDNVDTKLLFHMYRGGKINQYLNVPVEIDINKEIKPIIK